MDEFTGLEEIDAALADAPETVNTCGNRSRKIFHSADRYLFDFRLARDLWAQFDCESDAWYHGVWVAKSKRRVLMYLEGDIYFVQADSDAGYDAEIEALCKFHDPAPVATVIDETGITKFYQDRAEHFIDPARAAACGADQLPAPTETEEG